MLLELPAIMLPHEACAVARIRTGTSCCFGIKSHNQG
jgi:hypothetical protein